NIIQTISLCNNQPPSAILFGSLPPTLPARLTRTFYLPYTSRQIANGQEGREQPIEPVDSPIKQQQIEPLDEQV
ncbi:hypothetical protein KC346_g22824, partial [Hortaea werneckii]